MDRETLWKMKRCGNITSSCLPKLMTGGRRDMTAEELEKAKLAKSKRKTVDVMFGETALSYLYQVMRERRLHKPMREIVSKECDWGKANEQLALDWLRVNTFGKYTGCSHDFTEIVFASPFRGFGDSPDAYQLDNDGNITAVVEIKCPFSETKFEKLKEMTKEECLEEYLYQFCGHLIAHPTATELIYLIYDGVDDLDPLDTREPDALTRGILHIYTRHELQQHIDEVSERIHLALNYLDMVESKGLKIRDINEFI